MVAGCPRELIGCCLGTTSLKAGSTQFLGALFYCPRQPAHVILYITFLLMKQFKNAIAGGAWEWEE